MAVDSHSIKINQPLFYHNILFLNRICKVFNHCFWVYILMAPFSAPECHLCEERGHICLVHCLILSTKKSAEGELSSWRGWIKGAAEDRQGGANMVPRRKKDQGPSLLCAECAVCQQTFSWKVLSRFLKATATHNHVCEPQVYVSMFIATVTLCLGHCRCVRKEEGCDGIQSAKDVRKNSLPFRERFLN